MTEVKEKTWLKPEDVQKEFGISRNTEIEWRKKGWLPKPDIIGRRVFYPCLDDIKKFREEYNENNNAK
jgi:predicted site-specific integrase-resolvase